MSRQEALRRLGVGFIGLFVIVVTLAIANAIAVRFMTDTAKPQTTSTKPMDKPMANAPSQLTKLVEPDMLHDSAAPQSNTANTSLPARTPQR